MCSQRKIDSCCHGDASAASETRSFRLGGEEGGDTWIRKAGAGGAGARSQGLLEEGGGKDS